MTEQMHYATFGRNRRRPRRNNDRPRQVTKPSASTAAAAPPSKQQGRRPDSRDKRQDRRMTSSRRSDPDGAYCVSREEHSRDVKEKSRNSSSRGRNDSRPRNDSRGKPRGAPSNEKSRQTSNGNNKAPPQQRKSCTDARPTRSSQRSPSPHRSNTKPRSSSTRPSRPSARNDDKRLRSHSTKSTRSAKSAKSEAPTLTSELGGFDLKLSKATPTASRKPTTKMYLMNKISGLSILGACKKDTRSRPPPMRNAPSRTTRSRSEPRRKYMLEEESCTYMSECSSSSSYSSSSESEFISDYEEFSSSSSDSSDEESLKSMSESEEVEIYHAMMEESSFVEDEFVSDEDDEISGAQEFNKENTSPSVSTRSKALIQTLEAENAALRASVVALRSDWEVIVNRMARLQDGDDLSRDEVTDRSPNLDAIRELRDHALESLKQKRSQEMIERNKRESDLKSCIECVEELLCENERLYDNIVKLSQEREEILQELNSLKKQAVHSLEESHHSGLIMADEEIGKSHEEYIDDIASLLSEARKDPNGKNGDIGSEIVQLISRVMSQRTEVESTRYCSDEDEEKEDAAKEASMMENSALVVRRESSRQSTRRSSRGSDDSRHTRQMIVDDETEYDSPSCRSSTYSPRRRSSRNSSRGSDDSRHMIVDDETDYDASSRMSSTHRRRSSSYSESSRRRSSYYSDSSRQYSDDEYMSDSESEDEPRHHEPGVIHASMNSLFAGDGPSFSTQDGESNSPDLDVINEEYSDGESEYSSEDEEESPLMSPKKKSWYNAVRTVANRIRNKDRRRGRQRSPRNYIPDEEDCTTRDSSRRSSDNTILSDIEATHYPENISRCSPSTTTSTSRSSSSRSRGSSKSKRVSRQLSSSFTSIQEDHEMSFDEGITNQFPKDEEKQEVEVESLGHEASEQHDYNESNFSIGTPNAENEDLGTSYATKSPGNVSVDIPMVKPRRTVSTCASISHGDSEFDTSFADSCATSGSESTKERKGISITVVSRSSKFLTLPSSRSHTYMTFFTASLLKDQIDKVLYEQYHESMREIIGSMSSVDTELASGAKKKKKNKKYQGDLNELSERHGYGIYKSKNGNEYRGEWQHDKREGLGVVKIGNGDVFEGQFENNMKNGLGVYHYIDGECDLSMYKDDQRIGKSLRYTTDRKRAFLLSEDLTSKEVSIADAAMEAKSMGVIIQL